MVLVLVGLDAAITSVLALRAVRLSPAGLRMPIQGLLDDLQHGRHLARSASAEPGAEASAVHVGIHQLEQWAFLPIPVEWSRFHAFESIVIHVEIPRGFGDQYLDCGMGCRASALPVLASRWVGGILGFAIGVAIRLEIHADLPDCQL